MITKSELVDMCVVASCKTRDDAMEMTLTLLENAATLAGVILGISENKSEALFDKFRLVLAKELISWAPDGSEKDKMVANTEKLEREITEKDEITEELEREKESQQLANCIIKL